MSSYTPSIPLRHTQPREHEPHRELERRRKLRPSDVLIRAATVELLRQSVDGRGGVESREGVLGRIYAHCPATDYYLKAATSPATTTTATWAAELVNTAVVDFIATDMPTSAFAQLSAKAMTVTLEPGTGTLKIPSRASPQVLSGLWLAEGSAKPVAQVALTTTDLVPYKLAALSAFTEEMLNSTAIEQVMRETLAHDLTALLDSALLDATAASAVRPAGLWTAATSVTASAATPPSEAMLADLKALHSAVASGNPDARVVFIANPLQAIRINVTAPEYTNVIVSGYQASGSVGAVAADAIAMLISQPEFALSQNATLHMENAAPLPLATGPQGSAVMAAPTRSMFQEDAVALRCVLRTGWAKRRTGATALTTAVTW